MANKHIHFFFLFINTPLLFFERLLFFCIHHTLPEHHKNIKKTSEMHHCPLLCKKMS